MTDDQGNEPQLVRKGPDPTATCSCGIDEDEASGKPTGFRYDVVCPKHDGSFGMLMPNPKP